jgi:hypothetical protein
MGRGVGREGQVGVVGCHTPWGMWGEGGRSGVDAGTMVWWGGRGRCVCVCVLQRRCPLMGWGARPLALESELHAEGEALARGSRRSRSGTKHGRGAKGT